MAKVYPLEIENCGEDTYILRSKGHHDPDEFMQAVRSEGYDWPMGYPVHAWHKTSRCGPGWSEMIYVVVKPGTHGAYPVTECQEAEGNRLYEAVRDAKLAANPHTNYAADTRDAGSAPNRRRRTGMSEELKPCPWCGHEPDTGPDDWKREGDAFGYVFCSNESCVAKPCVRIQGEFVRGGGSRNSAACLARAIRAWNTRHEAEK